MNPTDIVEIRKAVNDDFSMPLNKSIGEYFYNGEKVSMETHLLKTDVKLPYDFYWGSAVVYNGEIHILGGRGGTAKHYKWNGSSWTSVSTLPYDFYWGSAVVYNGEIHILGGDAGNGNPQINHYKWNGSSWTRVSTIPFEFYKGSAVVYNNEIHILGGDGRPKNGNGVATYNYHYRWNGSSWTSVSTILYQFEDGSAVVYNNEIHILGSNRGDRNYHYRLNGSSWTSVSTLPYEFYRGSAVVYNNEIHILGGYGDKAGHYKWNGSSWTSVSTIPYEFYNGSAVVYNNEIHILGGYGDKVGHYKWNGSSWSHNGFITVLTGYKLKNGQYL